MLLRFRVANHRALRDPVELTLTTPAMRGSLPPDGDWVRVTTRVAGIYGANASGKSTILHALDFMSAAVTHSATTWGSREDFPYFPFALDGKSKNLPSAYELDLVVDSVRFTYGFESNSRGIEREWLHSYPTERRRVLFKRVGPAGSDISFGRSLQGENATISKLVKPTSLFLSVAANNNHPVLKDIHYCISRRIRYVRSTEERSRDVRWVRKSLSDPVLLHQAAALLKFADLGITGIRLETEELDADSRSKAERLFKSISASIEETSTPSRRDVEGFIEDIQTRICFMHQSDSPDEPCSLGYFDESSGTIAWLTIGVTALQALRKGEVCLIDEVHSSLHSRLAAVLIGMFKDPAVNKTGAQLIFTSHDLTLLGKMLGNVLASEDVWFTEKRPDGSTDLYGLQEFPVRDTDNIEKRYLEGRYGAVPMIEPIDIRNALSDDGKARDGQTISR